MMGDTGPCGPCSELHVDLTPDGDTRGSLVNKDDPRCIEIWNLVFIQFNANPDGSFTPLPQRHVDTGMGFERATAIIQGTKNFADFSGVISNYETDIFRPIFDELEKLSGRTYASTLPISADLGAQATAPALFGDSPESREKSSAGSPTTARESRALPEQIQIDIAFRVIADHIRTLSFAIADGIIPSNEGRGYVLRRILRRAVRYGRTLGFHEPFFFKLVDVVARTMGHVFPEVRTNQSRIEEVIQREEESFNKTLDRGIELFEREIARLSGRVGVPPAASGVSPEASNIGATYTRRRRLPHFEFPWAIYAVTITTFNKQVLSPTARTIVLDAIRHFHGQRYELFAATVMPDHAHLLFQPSIKETDAAVKTIFWSLGELMHSIKSFTAKEINKLEGKKGAVWEQERFDRFVRGDRDLEEKFRYIVENPWRAGLVTENQDYPWVWTQDEMVSGGTPDTAGETPTLPGSFAFRLYDTYGFPLDLTELMARERALTVDVAGFERLMDEQRARARKAQKKESITIEGETLAASPTRFLGYDFLETEAVVETVLPGKQSQELNIVLDRTTLYAEMGGQVGDHGLLHLPGHDRTEIGQLRISDTQKRGDVVVHRASVTDGRAPEPGEAVRVAVDADRRKAIQRHHTVTHLLHWGLHELISRDATQKGSYVGPDKLTFDFSSAALTKQQVRDVEKLVNEKIADNAPVSWTEIPYADAKKRTDIQQFFGEKYGDTVRVVQIGGEPQALNGYSMELCGGTHVRSTGEIEWFHIVREEAIAAGIRRIEAIAGSAVRDWAEQEAKKQQDKFEMLALKKSGLAELPALNSDSDAPELLRQIEQRTGRLEQIESQVRESEKQQAKTAEADLQSRAANIANDLSIKCSGKTSCVVEVPNADGKLLGAVADALKAKFAGPIFLAGTANGRVSLVAVVPKEMTSKVQANKLIQETAPIVGGKGGGRPESAQGGGADPAKIQQALRRAEEILSE